MKSSKDAKRIAKKLFGAAMAEGNLDLAVVKQIVSELGEKKPRGYLAVIDSFWKLVRLEVERNRAVVESAVELSAATRKQVEDDLTKKYGDQISVEYALCPELLGGMRIKVGSDVWDGSVKSRIERLDEKFN